MKFIQIVVSLISAIAIYLLSILDDIFLGIYIAAKESTCIELMIDDHMFHPASYLFQLGIFLGVIIFTILKQMFSVKNSTIACQTSLIILLILSLFTSNLNFIILLRFLNGFFIAGIVLGINILIKNSYKEYEFNQYIAITGCMTCFIDALITKFGEAIAIEFGVRSTTIILIFIICLGFMIFKNQYHDSTRHLSLLNASVLVASQYLQLISSPLSILFIAIGISEGTLDLFMSIITKILSNIYPDQDTILVGNTLSIISIVSSVYVLIYSYLDNNNNKENDKEENNNTKKCNKSQILLQVNSSNILHVLIFISISIVLMLINPIYLSSNNSMIHHILLIILAIVFTSTIYIVNFFIQKVLYASYSNAGSIASGIILYEAFFSFAIQKHGGFLLTINDNIFIFRNLAGYLSILLILIIIFNFMQKKANSKK